MMMCTFEKQRPGGLLGINKISPSPAHPTKRGFPCGAPRWSNPCSVSVRWSGEPAQWEVICL